MTPKYDYYSERWGSIPPTDREMLRYWIYETTWFFTVMMTVMFVLTSAAVAWKLRLPLGALIALLIGALVIAAMWKCNQWVRNGRGVVAKVSAFRGLVSGPPRGATNPPSSVVSAVQRPMKKEGRKGR